ncbi:LysM-like peptidoglycan-binding domain-containing protein [Vibrio maerlii]|uniref:LysM-like peptidoglycan-binding domain-containing protein n=1 Tax=Vibrio maerlii TaxID=2231648 RepID=UPI000E3BFC47|nr:LysM-like peptidoglycan-binding domain-containing protein [Vibrio maerlii]
MNRRHKKKVKVDHLAQAKEKFAAIEWKSKLDQIKVFWFTLPKLHRRILSVLIPVVLVLLVLPAPNKETVSTPKPSNERVAISLNNQGLSEVVDNEKKSESMAETGWQSYTVKSGDTLANVFRANELPMADLNKLVTIEGHDKPLSRIKQGQIVRFKLSSNGELDILQLEKAGTSVMFFRLSDGGFGRSK